ncbi:craniofacial development protein 2-like [Elysia marginata]|uniref:Craniofacial development protein 2-like n=1 Tax=Elysia marginata TaxID=1093978 RepID=A0AAV4J1S0_9GAST|nr:craniofacial development protein 2-like [Elysia marginata]
MSLSTCSALGYTYADSFCLKVHVYEEQDNFTADNNWIVGAFFLGIVLGAGLVLLLAKPFLNAWEKKKRQDEEKLLGTVVESKANKKKSIVSEKHKEVAPETKEQKGGFRASRFRRKMKRLGSGKNRGQDAISKADVDPSLARGMVDVMLQTTSNSTEVEMADQDMAAIVTMESSMEEEKEVVRLGAWNAQTMYETGKTAQVISEMQKYRLNIIGISEVRWNGADHYVAPTGGVMYYSCRDHGLHRGGVALIFDRKTNKSLMEWEPINHRIIRARLYSRFAKLTIVQCYASIEDAADDEFYSKLQEVLTYIPKHHITIVMGDLNAKVGSDNTGFEKYMGKQGRGVRNQNGERFLELCMGNNLVIGGTIFKHEDIHKETWNSPDGQTRNQINHAAINRRWRSSLVDARAIRGGDIGSDHNLVLTKLRLKLEIKKKHQPPILFDSAIFKKSSIKRGL